MMHKPAPPIIGKKNRPLRQQKPGRTVVVCSIDPAEVGNDEQIFEHNKLLQQSILECLDRETVRFAEELREHQDEIQEIRASKEDMALFLSHSITENKRLNEQLSNARTSLEDLSNQSKTTAAAKIAAEMAVKKLAMREKQLTSRVEVLDEELEKSKEMVRGMQLATAAFHSDIKVRTLTQQRLEQDNVILEDKLRDESAKYESLKTIVQEKSITEDALSEERHSTAQLNTHLDIMLKGAESDLSECRQNLVKVETSRNILRDQNVEYEHKLLKNNSEQKKLRINIEDGRHIHAKVLLELEEAKHALQHLEAQSVVRNTAMCEMEAELSTEKQKRQHAEQVLHKRGITDDGSSQETRDMESQVSLLKEHIHSHETTIKELRATLMQAKHAYDGRVTEENMNESSYDASIEKLKNEYDDIVAKGKKKEVMLSNDLARVSMEKRSSEAMLMEISSQHHALAAKHVELQAVYSMTDEAALRAEYNADRSKRKENQLMEKLRGTIQDQANESRLSHGLVVDSLKTQLQETEVQLKTMTRQWKEVQTECVRWKRKCEYVSIKKEHLEHSDAISTQGKRRVQVENNKLTSTLTKARIKSDVTSVKLRRTREVLSSTTVQKETMKHQLEDVRHVLEGREQEYKKSINVLRGTIHILQKQLRDKKRTNRDILIQEQHTEVRQQLTKERLEVCQIELQTTKADLFELKAKHARMMKGGSSNGAASKARQAVEATKSLEAMLLKRRMQRMQASATANSSSGRRGRTATGKGTKATTEDDNMALGGVSRNKLELQKALRMAAERLHEIVVLKNALEKAENQRRHYESQYMRYKDEKARLKEQKYEQLAMANRALRAESMASWMEKQLLAAVSDFKKIDYTYHPEIDISPSLEKVLKEDNWLTSGDEIARGMSEKELAALARGRETPML